MPDPTQPALSIPVLPPGTDVLSAALAYASAGWYVGPTRHRSKNPGGVLGADWPSRTTRDPERIAAEFAGTDHGLFLHCGRSGAVVFDVDVPDALPAWAQPLVLLGPHQSTRTNLPGRGHYVFALPEGKRYGNGTGTLGPGWGEVRGTNGVIVVAPSIHEKAGAEGGRYTWVAAGDVPLLPEELAKALPEGKPSGESALTDAEAQAWLDALPEGRTHLGTQTVQRYLQTTTKGSRHDALVTAIRYLVHCEGEGQEVRRGDLDTLATAHRGRLADRHHPNGARPSRGDFGGVLAWALGQPGNPGPFTMDAGDTPRSRPTDEWADLLQATPELAQIDRFARSRLLSPWAVAGCALVRTLLLLPGSVVLPPIVGSAQPPHLFCALYGPSGSGKSSAVAVARELIRTALLDDPLDEVQLRSGEALAAVFRRYNSRAKTYEVVRDRALILVDEVHTLTAQQARAGSTLLPTLRSAWSGSALGGQAADVTRPTVPAMSYRLGLVAGVQTGQAGPLVNDTAGTAQRMLWMPAVDASLELWAGGAVAPLQPTVLTDGLTVDSLTGWQMVPVCQVATDAIQAGALARGRGDGHALDGHALQNRLRVALALAVLSGRCEVAPGDWELAAGVMARSDAVRAAAADSEPRPKSDAQRAVEVEGALEDRRLAAAVAAVGRAVALHQADRQHRADRPDATWVPGCTSGCLRRGMAGTTQRTYLDAALAELLRTGAVVATDGRYHPA